MQNLKSLVQKSCAIIRVRASINRVKAITDERCTAYHAPGHPERPERISATVAKLKAQQTLPITWAGPDEVVDDAILRAHVRYHIARLEVSQDFDADTKWFPDIAGHARRAVGAALAALKAARAGETVFSLIRPPGHHATKNRAMGFCYLNNPAITALEALATGARRVAVYDFDVHHGNGTEDILLDHPGVVFYSVHQHPCYPGTGTEHRGGNCFNYPVAPYTPRKEYRTVLQTALEAMKQFKPDFVVVSAGFDAYIHDPIAQETLEIEDFHWMGDSLRKLGVPMASLLEGGYSDDLPELILAYLKGLNGI